MAAVTESLPLESIRFETGDTIRRLAERHLKDPDLWPQILELSGIASPAELQPGVMLKVPVLHVAAADTALATSLVAIQRATAEGARIFAPVEIGGAIESRETAVERRGIGAWDEVVSYAGTATELADTAYDISLKERDRAAEAVVSDVNGSVEGRTPAEPSWSSRRLRDVLVEFERLRTLSTSTAQVTFRDLSRLRLNANSNAVIQRMRTDPLTGGQSTRVSLVEGDFYALLNQLGDRTEFEVDVPGIETRTRSADFWVKRDAEAARFANYDTAALEITSRGETVTLGENEGALVASTGETQQVTVLDRPALVAPTEGARLYDATVALEWSGPATAVGYWVEIAEDVDFNVMKVSQWGLRETRHDVEGLPPGDYHWRISALDRLGLPGERSASSRFSRLEDVTPPFMTVLAPTENEIVVEPQVTVSGESELGVRLSLNGRYLPIRENGSFAETVVASVGENLLRLEAVDPAGNRTERLRRFIHRPDAAVALAFDPAIPRGADGRFLTRGDALDIRGMTTAEPGSHLRVLDGAGRSVVETLVAEGGAFAFAAPASAGGAAYVIEVIGPGGAVEGRGAFDAVIDASPPAIALDVPAPTATANRWLDLVGSAGDAVALTMDGAPVALEDGRFEVLATLSPGPNGIELVATDAVGNVAVHRIETLLDVDPPEILAAEARRPAGEAGPIEIVVEARDAAGLRQTAEYTVEIGGAERRGFLRCDAAVGLCRETLSAEPGQLRLIEVVVEDYAGNAATLAQ